MAVKSAQVAVEARIRSRVREFDLISLLRLLHQMGYSEEEIRFRSHITTTSQVALIEDIEFAAGPSRGVAIILNLGLLSAQNQLPSYFFKKMDEESIDTVAFIDFLSFFDHHLIRTYLLNLYPELNPAYFPDPDGMKQRYVGMMDLRSPSALQFFFQLVFPELSVAVDKTPLNRTLKVTFPRLGITRLGHEAIMGREMKIPVYGLRVTLMDEDEYTTTGEPWSKKIRERLEAEVFPTLGAVGMDLEIFLLILSKKGWVQLQQDSYLGYDRIRGGELKPRRIKIFRGYLGG